jgi:hypothetical protein
MMKSALRGAARLVVGLAAASLATTAHAALGHAAATVQDDRLHMSAALASAASPVYTTHTLTLINGGEVKEFSSAGVIFAVSWRGPGRPDLRQLLGERFAILQADNATSGGRRLRMPLAVERSDFIVRGGGHPGAFWGLAYLPGLTPGGVSAADLH